MKELLRLGTASRVQKKKGFIDPSNLGPAGFAQDFFTTMIDMKKWTHSFILTHPKP